MAKPFLGAARRAEEDGSLIIVATVLGDVGSCVAEVICEEMSSSLDRRLRTFPHRRMRNAKTP